MQLVLITASYPFDGEMEQTFIEPELAVLRHRFDRIVIVPQTLSGTRLDVPADVIVRTDFAAQRTSATGWLASIAPGLRLWWSELRAQPSAMYRPRAFKRLGRFVLDVIATRRWVRRFVETDGSVERDTIFYTWWLGAATMGLGLVKARRPDVVIVSRAHAWDLYASQLDPPYLPGRPAVFKGIDRVYPDSTRGEEFIRATYPGLEHRCFASRQGIADPGFRSPPSTDGVFRVVSCSLLVPRKRVDLLVHGLAAAARRRPEQRIEWRHVGDGPDRAKVETALDAARAQQNFSGEIVGILPPNQLMDLYRTTPVDLFVNVSQSEGTPVSLMEATGCGIPILATAVGGNVEVVAPDVGVLLPEDVTVDEIADAIAGLAGSTDSGGRRSASRQRWEQFYDAATNYQKFADDLIALRSSR